MKIENGWVRLLNILVTGVAFTYLLAGILLLFTAATPDVWTSLLFLVAGIAGVVILWMK